MSSIFASLSAVLVSVFIYNSTINLVRASHDVELTHKTVLTFNAELKNKLYSLLDAKNLRALAEVEGLKKISNPEYFEVKIVPILAKF